MTEQTLNAAIQTFAHGYITMRADEHVRGLLQTVPVAYIADLYPYCRYEEVVQPVFDFIHAAEPGKALMTGQHWSPHLQTFFNTARYLMYARAYGGNGGAPPARISQVYMHHKNGAHTQASYITRYNRIIKNHLNNQSALADPHYISEWDTLVCFALETICIQQRGYAYQGDMVLTAEETAWFADLLTWLALIYQPPLAVSAAR